MYRDVYIVPDCIPLYRIDKLNRLCTVLNTDVVEKKKNTNHEYHAACLSTLNLYTSPTDKVSKHDLTVDSTRNQKQEAPKQTASPRPVTNTRGSNQKQVKSARYAFDNDFILRLKTTPPG